MGESIGWTIFYAVTGLRVLHWMELENVRNRVEDMWVGGTVGQPF